MHMEAIIENMLDGLVGVAVQHSSDKAIQGNDYNNTYGEFCKLKTFWGKACFIVFLKKCKNDSLRACAKKIQRNVELKERDVYDRYIKLFINEIQRVCNKVNREKVITDRLKHELMEYGETEFITLCRVIWNAGYDWAGEIKGVSIDKVKSLKIKQIYG